MERPMDLLERVYLPEKKWRIAGMHKCGKVVYGTIIFDTEKAANDHLEKLKKTIPEYMKQWKTFLILPI